jgi:hypothetical protein
MVKIETDVPFTTNLPARYSGFPRKWPWTEMKPGDSFCVLTEAEMKSARNSLYQHRLTVHCQIPSTWVAATQKTPEGYRLWLIDTKNIVTPVDTPT